MKRALKNYRVTVSLDDVQEFTVDVRIFKSELVEA
jgi:hypothetical protein